MKQRLHIPFLRSLRKNFLLLARLNLKHAEYEILKRDYRLHGKELELEHNFELYNRRILNENLIHPDDVELYRSRITLSSLQDIFFGGHKQLTYQFRRCLDNVISPTTMDFSPATNVMHRIHGCCYSQQKNSLRRIFI